MGAFGQWLLHEDQKDVWDSIYASAVAVAFFALSALLLWPLGRLMLVWSLLKGYWLFCIVLGVTALLLFLLRRVFRIDLETRYDAYVISAFAFSGLLLAGWSAFAALAVRVHAEGASVWVAAALYVVGVLSCYVAFAVACVYYTGQMYRLVNLPLAWLCFIIFSVWPAAARFVYGWFFDLF